MNENHVSTGHVATVIGWLVVVALMTGAWVTMMVNPAAWRYAGLLAASGCAASCAAAVVHLRTYAVRVSELVRASTDRLAAGQAEHVEGRARVQRLH